MIKMKKTLFFTIILMLTNILLTGCINNAEYTSFDEKYSEVSLALEDKYIRSLKIGEKSTFNPSMIVMRNINNYYFLVPYTFTDSEFRNDKNDKYANASHEGWLNVGSEYITYSYDIIKDKDIDEASVTIEKTDNNKYLVRMILPTKYPINTSKDSKTISYIKSKKTYYYENAVVYSKN